MRKLGIASCRASVVGASVLFYVQAKAQTAMDAAAPAPLQNEAARTKDTAEAQNSDQGEIVVTAEKRADTASRISMSISVLGGAALDRLRIKDPTDLVKQVPGFTVTKAASGIPIYNLRGVGFNTPNLSSSSPVGFYVDQVAYAFPYMASGPIYDLERVEVLKGPQGTLYGRNTTGGLVNFITAKPADEAAGMLRLDAGNYESFDVEGFFTGPLSATLKARFAFKTDMAEKGWQKSVTRNDRLGEINRTAFRASLQWDPAAEFSALLSFNYWRDKSDTQAPQLAYFIPESAPFGKSRADVAPSLLTRDANNSDADWTPSDYQLSASTSAPRRPYRKDGEFYSGLLEIRYQFSDTISLTSLTAYNRLTRADAQNLDGTPFEIVSNDLFGSISSISEELRIAGEGDRFNWIVGGYFSKDKLDENQLVYLGDFSTINLLRFVGGTLNDPRYTPEQVATGFRVNNQLAIIRNRSISAFANAQFAFNDTIKVTGGLRYTTDRSRHAGCAADSQGNTVPVWNTAVSLLAGAYPRNNIQPSQCITFTDDFSGPAGLVRGVLKEDNLSWRGTANWTPTRDSLLYGSVSRGYKSGAFPVIPANLAKQFVPATQEKVTSFELGTKLRAGPARFTLAGFYNDYRDKQVFGAIADPIFGRLDRLVNIPRSETYGLEASIDWNVTDQLEFHGAGSYLRSKVVRYTGFDPFGEVVDFAGDEFPNTPRWQISGNILHSLPLDNVRNLETSLDASYQSRSHGDFRDLTSYSVFAPFRSTVRPVINERLFNIPGYVLINGSLTLVDTSAGWSAGIWMRNIFDKDYSTSATFTRDTLIRFSGMPRTYGVTAQFNF